VCLQAVSRTVSMYHCISSLFAPRCTAVWLDVAGRPEKMTGLSLLNVSPRVLVTGRVAVRTCPRVAPPHLELLCVTDITAVVHAVVVDFADRAAKMTISLPSVTVRPLFLLDSVCNVPFALMLDGRRRWPACCCQLFLLPLCFAEFAGRPAEVAGLFQSSPPLPLFRL
jgi:hypothetical protein